MSFPNFNFYLGGGHFVCMDVLTPKINFVILFYLRKYRVLTFKFGIILAAIIPRSS